jgi:hypothetical protein
METDKMTGTPETDQKAVPHIGFYSCATVPAEFARKLERERDEARNKMADALQEVDLRTLDFERMKKERDEAREAFVIATDQVVLAQSKLRETDKERQAFVIAQQEVITNLILEHNKALDKINDLKNILR